jgi:hypothetical protein
MIAQALARAESARRRIAAARSSNATIRRCSSSGGNPKLSPSKKPFERLCTVAPFFYAKPKDFCLAAF